MVLATLLALLFFAFPVYWMFATAFKPTNAQGPGPGPAQGPGPGPAQGRQQAISSS